MKPSKLRNEILKSDDTSKYGLCISKKVCAYRYAKNQANYQSETTKMDSYVLIVKVKL
ncbi:hypothetical protein BTH41_01575 [Bacillus mycoides]|nr:hypothetical protein BTH41_01575 [Bacillus mycoides]